MSRDYWVIQSENVLYRFNTMPNAHNELMLLAHFGDKFIWRLARIKGLAEHFCRPIKRSSEAIALCDSVKICILHN